MVFYIVFFSIFSFYILSLCPRFLFWDYHVVGIKHFIDITFPLIVSSLHFPIQFPLTSSSPFIYFFQKLPCFMFCVCYQIEIAIIIFNVLLFNLYGKHYYLTFYSEVALQFSNSVYLITQNFVYFCFFVSGRRAPFNIY